MKNFHLFMGLHIIGTEVAFHPSTNMKRPREETTTVTKRKRAESYLHIKYAYTNGYYTVNGYYNVYVFPVIKDREHHLRDHIRLYGKYLKEADVEQMEMLREEKNMTPLFVRQLVIYTFIDQPGCLKIINEYFERKGLMSKEEFNGNVKEVIKALDCPVKMKTTYFDGLVQSIKFTLTRARPKIEKKNINLQDLPVELLLEIGSYLKSPGDRSNFCDVFRFPLDAIPYKPLDKYNDGVLCSLLGVLECFYVNIELVYRILCYYEENNFIVDSVDELWKLYFFECNQNVEDSLLTILRSMKDVASINPSFVKAFNAYYIEADVKHFVVSSMLRWQGQDLVKLQDFLKLCRGQMDNTLGWCVNDRGYILSISVEQFGYLWNAWTGKRDVMELTIYSREKEPLIQYVLNHFEEVEDKDIDLYPYIWYWDEDSFLQLSQWVSNIRLNYDDENPLFEVLNFYLSHAIDNLPMKHRLVWFVIQHVPEEFKEDESIFDLLIEYDHRTTTTTKEEEVALKEFMKIRNYFLGEDSEDEGDSDSSE